VQFWACNSDFFQASEAQQKVYADMRTQLEKLESDLEQSKLTREKLQQEFDKQIDEMKNQNTDDVISKLRKFLKIILIV